MADTCKEETEMIKPNDSVGTLLMAWSMLAASACSFGYNNPVEDDTDTDTDITPGDTDGDTDTDGDGDGGTPTDRAE